MIIVIRVIFCRIKWLFRSKMAEWTFSLKSVYSFSWSVQFFSCRLRWCSALECDTFGNCWELNDWLLWKWCFLVVNEVEVLVLMFLSKQMHVNSILFTHLIDFSVWLQSEGSHPVGFRCEKNSEIFPSFKYIIFIVQLFITLKHHCIKHIHVLINTVGLQKVC